MTYDYDSLPPNCLTKIREVSKLKQDLDEREDKCIFWYRQFEDAKEARSMDSSKSLKRRNSPLKEVKGHE